MKRLLTVGVLLLGLLSADALAADEYVNWGKGLRPKASAIARETFIDVPNLGPHTHDRHKRYFALRGQLPLSVEGADGSTLTGFPATLSSSADGTGDTVLLFDDSRFVGYAWNRMAGNLELYRASPRALIVRYAKYRHLDSICCPSSLVAVTLSLERIAGRRLRPSASPNLRTGRLAAPPRTLSSFGGRTD